MQIRELKGIGPKKEELFGRLGIQTAEELLSAFPRTYRQYPQPSALSDFSANGKYPQTAICARLSGRPVVKKTRRMDLVIARVFEGDQKAELFWFRTPYVVSQLPMGTPLVFYGTMTVENGRLRMDQPAIYTVAEYETLKKAPQPIYSLTAGLTNATVISAVRQALEQLCPLAETLPADLCKDRGLLSFQEATEAMHFPDSMEQLTQARRRHVYEEFLLFLLNVRLMQSDLQSAPNPLQLPDQTIRERIRARLPYALTTGQEETLSAIYADLNGPVLSQRLIQGDVGSGKTIVAFLAMALVCQNGYQAAIMAPTEVLARQHEQTFLSLCEQCGLSFPVICLTGSMTAAKRRKALERIATEPGAMIIGTQALIQDAVSFCSLALVVADEQHRFGVRQRSILTEKGLAVHLLVMSATPIPRTLAMILYGDMNLSVIREMPKGRQRIKTAVIRENDRSKADRFLAKEIAAGHQCYVICPLVEASEDVTEAQNVSDYSKLLAERMGPDVRIGVLHGKMKPAAKDAVMTAFAAGELDILVSTTVVEVGINVPNATVMLVENADRFGLAQLHQLRGRVGRGEAQSYCILMDTSSPSGEPHPRLMALAQSADGFEIAQQDLQLRGPGDFLGIRQSGEMSFAVGDVFLDADVLSLASEDVQSILSDDPHLEQPAHHMLVQRLKMLRERQYTVL